MNKPVLGQLRVYLLNPCPAHSKQSYRFCSPRRWQWIKCVAHSRLSRNVWANWVHRGLPRSWLGAPGWLSQLSVWLWLRSLISQFLSLSPASGSVLTAWSLESALDSVSPSLYPFPAHALSLSLKDEWTLKKFFLMGVMMLVIITWTLQDCSED